MDTELGRLLAAVEKPGRYAGGEYGAVRKEGPGLLHVAISYPDLYEIGMSNLAVRLIYRLLNGLEGVACERVFAPALDFERALRARGQPLRALESGRPLRAFDLLGFSVGYELTFTNLLAMLDLGGVSLRREARAEDEPLVVAGGPAVTNPVPFGPYLDAVFIGEIEGEALELIGELARLKREGAGRAERLAALGSAPFVWTEEGNRPVRRVLWTGFGAENPAPAPFPVPSLRTVQDHGAVEIMRGCPNGCRFCHAGIFYRPFRVKETERILREVDGLVFGCGYREIALSSLSTGDFPGIVELVRTLNSRYRRQRVSFSLPSLRIDSLGLELLSEVSAVRKSGLTFAVETPVEAWQRGVNKLAPLERTLEILEEAKSRGWRGAKFYFMVGLPVAEGQDEVGPIVEFLRRVRERTRLEITANVSAFIPKPHTPFQWAAQLTEQEAVSRIMAVKRSLAAAKVRVRYHAPFLSLLEGILSRGDRRAGELAGEAFRRGARFDSWEELAQRELWRQLMAEAAWGVEEECCRARGLEEPLPWERVHLGAGTAYLRAEYRRALAGELTAACAPDCSQPCGVCGPGVHPRLPVKEPAAAPVPDALTARPEAALLAPSSPPRRVLFGFTKAGPALYLGHLDVLGVFERALQRARYEPTFTEGFNPKPRLEFAHALPLGVASQEEIALVTLADFDDPESFRSRLNQALPAGLEILRARALPPLQPGVKKHAPMALYWGSDYLLRDRGGGALAGLEAGLAAAGTVLPSAAAGELELRVPAAAKPGSILKILAGCGVESPAASGLEVSRSRCWATGPDGGPLSYFELELPS